MNDANILGILGIIAITIGGLAAFLGVQAATIAKHLEVIARHYAARDSEMNDLGAQVAATMADAGNDDDLGPVRLQVYNMQQHIALEAATQRYIDATGSYPTAEMRERFVTRSEDFSEGLRDASDTDSEYRRL